MKRFFLRNFGFTTAWLLYAIWLQTGCIPSPPFQFDLSDNYTRDRLSGYDIGGRSIGLCPLLTVNGPVEGDRLPSAATLEVFRKKRPDLSISGSDSMHSVLSMRLGPAEVTRYYSLLFKGESAALQTEESLWKAVPSDYLLVIRMTHGMWAKSFGGVSVKRIRLEAELWDCREMETAWRINVLGRCSRAGLSDQKFVMEAIGTIAAALPSSAPAYDTKSW